MTAFLAIKVHYDHRPSLAPHLKYSTLPTPDQYNEYLSLFHDDKIGGNGFHECLNFAIQEGEPVRFYLPPTCLPAKDKMNDEFVIFSFTYKGDRDLPAHIVGVHAGAQLLSTDPRGLRRDERYRIGGIEPLQYHGEAPADLVTLLNPPLKYEFRQGIYTPSFATWGFGLRYIEREHAAKIICTSIELARSAAQTANVSEQTVLERQIEVLSRIDKRYSLSRSGVKTTTSTRLTPNVGGLPDREIGFFGEKVIYDREVAYVQTLGRSPSEVEWVSQAVPTSPYDIKTIRPSPSGIREHFIEVKSSRSDDDTNVYISSSQVAFFEVNSDRSTFALVRFNSASEPTIRELSLGELRSEFDLIPIKFKLASRNPNAA